MKSLPPDPMPAIPLLHESTSAGSLLLNLTGALAIVVVLIIVTALLMRRTRWGGAIGSEKSLTVRQSVTLGQRERVVIVEVGERRLLLGVTPGGISLLTELESPQAEESERVVPGSFRQTWRQTLRKKSEDHS